jgi:quercetin dioxygenase-like cupin family protein
MEEVNRRSAIALGMTGALCALTMPAVAQEYGPNDGKELSPGVRMVEIGTRDSDLPAYKSIQIVDVVWQPGATSSSDPMPHDMVCQIMAGEFKTKKATKEYTLKKGDVYTCGKGTTDIATNTSKGVGVHRIAMLIAA